MARLYSNENIPLQVVEELRKLGHDVLTSFEAGNANRAVPDDEVLKFAVAEDRILLSLNRRHFIRLHKHWAAGHCGIVVCSADADFRRLAGRIHAAVHGSANLRGELLRVNRPND